MKGLNEDGLILSESYAETMRDQVDPWLHQRRTDSRLMGYENRPLFVSRFLCDAPEGTVLMVHGFTENVDKYRELIHSLLLNHFSVLIWDQRGHGRSWRADGLSDVSLTHVDHFEEYVYDMEIICDQVLSCMPKPHRIFCHSMGGAVSALFLEAHQSTFDRAVMCAPMIAPNLSGLPKPVGKLLCRGMMARGRGKSRVFISKPYVYPDSFDTACANGRARFDWYETLRRQHPEFQNNSPTYGWTLESIDVTDKILKPQAVERIDAEVRLYTAQLDTMVLPAPQKSFIHRVRRGEQRIVRGAKHEIYRSPDEVLFPWWKDVLGFLKG